MWENLAKQSAAICVSFARQCHQKQIIQNSPILFIARNDFNWFNFGATREWELFWMSRLHPLCSNSPTSLFHRCGFFRWRIGGVFFSIPIGQFSSPTENLSKSNKWSNMYWNMADQTIDIKFASVLGRKKSSYVNKLILIGLQVPQVRYVSVLFFGRNLFNGKHAFGEIRLQQKFSV
jgi:hypothetical protein